MGLLGKFTIGSQINRIRMWRQAVLLGLFAFYGASWWAPGQTRPQSIYMLASPHSSNWIKIHWNVTECSAVCWPKLKAFMSLWVLKVLGFCLFVCLSVCLFLKRGAERVGCLLVCLRMPRFCLPGHWLATPAASLRSSFSERLSKPQLNGGWNGLADRRHLTPNLTTSVQSPEPTW